MPNNYRPPGIKITSSKSLLPIKMRLPCYYPQPREEIIILSGIISTRDWSCHAVGLEKSSAVGTETCII
jgi:hypothetical protein